MKRPLGRLAIVVAAGWMLILSGACNPLGTRQAGDERPPIIISDGSIDLFIERTPLGYSRGKWNDTASGNGRKLIHMADGNPNNGNAVPPVNKFDVFLLNGNGTGMNAKCTDPDHAFKVTTLKITYFKPGMGGGGNNATMNVALESGNLTVTLPDEAATLDNVHNSWKSTGGNAAERLVEVGLPVTGGTTVTCTFDTPKKKRGVITIFQRQ